MFLTVRRIFRRARRLPPLVSGSTVNSRSYSDRFSSSDRMGNVTLDDDGLEGVLWFELDALVEVADDERLEDILFC